MAIDGKSDDDIRAILGATRTIALVGASANADRPSNRVLAFLLSRGFTVHPVNPGLAGKTIHGATVYVRASDAPGAVVDEALALPERPKAVWMQLGVVDTAAAARAEAEGVKGVMDRCPAIEIPRLGL